MGRTEAEALPRRPAPRRGGGRRFHNSRRARDGEGLGNRRKIASPKRRKAELGLFVGFLSFDTLHWNFTGVSPEMSPECQRNFQNVTEMSPECRRNFAGILTWSTLKKAITTTRPFHTPKTPGIKAAEKVVALTPAIRGGAILQTPHVERRGRRGHGKRHVFFLLYYCFLF
jgi:hypothetical protein